MDTVNEGRFLLLDVSGHGLVRREHEFFDDLVRHVPFGPDDLGHAALEVEHDLRLGQVEVDASPLGPLGTQDLHELRHELEFREERGVALPLQGVLVREDLAHGRIGHALVAVDDTFVDIVLQDIARGRDVHLAGEREPVYVRVQTADAVRERGGQHGDGPVREVYARAALVGLFVEIRALFHVVGHIGDMHPEPESRPGLFDGDGVVEVTRCLAVDRDRGLLPEVVPTLVHRCRDLLRDLAGLAERGKGELRPGAHTVR